MIEENLLGFKASLRNIRKTGAQASSLAPVSLGPVMMASGTLALQSAESFSARSARQHKAWGGVTVKRNPRSEPIKNDEPAAAGDSRCDYQDAHFRSAVARSAGLINSH